MNSPVSADGPISSQPARSAAGNLRSGCPCQRRCLVSVSDQDRAGGVLSDVGADRAEQEPSESAVAAAAYDQHEGALGSVEKDAGSTPFADLKPRTR